MYATKYKRNKIDNPKKFQNEFEAFKKRIGKHKVWFYALDEKRQWDVLFYWKKEKFFSKGARINRKRGVREMNQGLSLNLFLHSIRKAPKFYVTKQRLRQSALEHLINN